MTKTNVERLMERFDKNLDEFKREMLDLDKETIFALAPLIVATIDAHNLLKTHEYLDECDAAYLLLFKNPLEMIADVWADYLENDCTDFEQAICDVLDDDENTDIYEFFGRVDEPDDDYEPLDYRRVAHLIMECAKLIRNSTETIDEICEMIQEEDCL